MDFAKRAYDRSFHIDPIVRSLLGTDFHVVLTQDWRPPGHISFASTHGAAPFSHATLPYGHAAP